MSKQHRKVEREEDDQQATVSMDYGFSGPKEELESNDDVTEYVKFLAVRDRKSKSIEAVVVPSRGT